MKKFLVTIVCLSFFVVNTGFVVNLHYCMDRFASWGIGSETPEKCGACGMESGITHGCCHDEVKLVKLQQDVVTPGSVTESLPPTFTVSFLSYWYTQFPLAETVHQPCPDHRPYLAYRQKIYIEHGVFRI